MGPSSRRWDVPAAAEQVSALRRAVVDFAGEHGFGPDALADLALAVSEALTNVVLHAYRDGEGGAMRVDVEIDGAGVLVVAVGDDGPGHRPNPQSPGLGLGIPIMRQVADAVELPADGEPGPVRMRFRRR